MNFFIGAIFSNFLESQKMNKNKLLNFDQNLWVNIQKSIIKEKPINYTLPQKRFNRIAYNIAKSRYFKIIIDCSLLINVINLSMYFYNASNEYKMIIFLINYILVMIYLIEVIINFLAYGIWGFISFKNGETKILIVIFSISVMILNSYYLNYFGKIKNEENSLKILSLSQILVLMRLFKKFKKLKRLTKSLLFSSNHLLSIIILLIIIFFIYAITGCFLFGKVSNGQVINEYINFNNFFNALVTLFTCSTQDNWAAIMSDCSDICINQEIKDNCGSSWATIYFFSFIFLVGQILLNMIILILMQAFEEFYINPDQPLKFYEDYVKKFKLFWSKFCHPKFIFYMDERNIISFYRSLGKPLG